QYGIAVRVGLRVARVQGVLVHVESPRKARVASVELVVEPVAPAADGLRHRQTRRESVGEEGERDTGATTADPRPERSPGDRAPDTQAALPDLEGEHRVAVGAEVVLGRRDDVVDARTDDAGRYGEDRHIESQPVRCTAVAEPDLRDRARDHD